MTSRDRAELLVAAIIGAMLGGVTGYLLSSLVESGGWLKILIWPLIGAVVFTGLVFVFGLFVRECFCPAASRDGRYPRVLWGLRCFSLTPPKRPPFLDNETCPPAVSRRPGLAKKRPRLRKYKCRGLVHECQDLDLANSPILRFKRRAVIKRLKPMKSARRFPRP